MNCEKAVFGVQNTSLDMFWELLVEIDEPCVWLVEIQELSYGRGNNWDSNTLAPCFRGNGLICGLVGGAALSVRPSRYRLVNKWACGTAMASIAEAFGREWTIGYLCHVWTCAHVSVCSLHNKVQAESLHLINKSVKKRSIVCRFVWTMFGDLKVRPTLSSEIKYSSSNCPNQVRQPNSSPS